MGLSYSESARKLGPDGIWIIPFGQHSYFANRVPESIFRFAGSVSQPPPWGGQIRIPRENPLLMVPRITPNGPAYISEAFSPYHHILMGHFRASHPHQPPLPPITGTPPLPSQRTTEHPATASKSRTDRPAIASKSGTDPPGNCLSLCTYPCRQLLGSVLLL